MKTFLAFGMLLNNVAALDVDEVDEPWARGVRTRVQPGLFEQLLAAGLGGLEGFQVGGGGPGGPGP